MDKDKAGNGKTITIYDTAEEAGVSASTVSRVLNGSASVRRNITLSPMPWPRDYLILPQGALVL